MSKVSTDFRLLVQNARQMVVVCNEGQRFLLKDGMQNLAVIEHASLVIGHDGLVKAVGGAKEIDEQFNGSSFEKVLDVSGLCVIPGLVDAHTHPVWAGDRVHEFAMKLAGATYMEVHKAGGGIHFTVEQTRRASEGVLQGALMGRLTRMLRAGTTLVECKSGYGLDTHTEMTMLRTIHAARHTHPIGISATYCGAHAVPRGKTQEEALRGVLEEQLPQLQDCVSRGEVSVDNIDVFCEKGVFELDATRKILSAGRSMGLNINFHGDELHPMKAAELGAELGALAVSHLEEVSDEGIAAMATAKTAAVLLPTTAYILRLKQPRAQDMLDAGVIVALGSDFNPNAYCCSMPLVMHLACVNMRLSLNEALAAATINAAYALGAAHTHGSLEPGKQGDLIIINSPRWEHLIYQLGGHQELIKHVVIKGQVVYDNQDTLGL
ncbi:probable imidazolonepropionase [Alosa sapidissima]|uniref:probable imidazolonepropionase n=1 Tax=Alosa sapidissima TaxID=34773 RepID=UPI001C08E158|nr:probable imidazolonepropionase [Alosa sapidissima]